MKTPSACATLIQTCWMSEFPMTMAKIKSPGRGSTVVRVGCLLLLSTNMPPDQLQLRGTAFHPFSISIEIPLLRSFHNCLFRLYQLQYKAIVLEGDLPCDRYKEGL